MMLLRRSAALVAVLSVASDVVLRAQGQPPEDDGIPADAGSDMIDGDGDGAIPQVVTQVSVPAAVPVDATSPPGPVESLPVVVAGDDPDGGSTPLPVMFVEDADTTTDTPEDGSTEIPGLLETTAAAAELPAVDDGTTTLAPPATTEATVGTTEDPAVEDADTTTEMPDGSTEIPGVIDTTSVATDLPETTTLLPPATTAEAPADTTTEAPVDTTTEDPEFITPEPTTAEPATTTEYATPEPEPTPPPPGTCHTCHETWGDDPDHPCNRYPGQLFPHCDSGGYIQCGWGGGCVELPCAPGTVFNERYQTCVHDCVLPEEYQGEDPLCTNPCTEENIEAGQFHHDLCTDPSKYIQCDAFGGCFIRHCPTPLIWDSNVNNPEVEPWEEEPNWSGESGACNWADPTACPLPTVCGSSACYADEDGEAAPTDYTTKFEVCNDDGKFYVCNEYGGCDVSKCPGWGMIFDYDAQDCVESSFCDIPADCDNPCDGIDLEGGDHPYQAHCDDDKYLQCNSVGGCRVLYCEYDLVWDDDAKACVPPDDVEELPSSMECSEQCANPCGVPEDVAAENFHFSYCLSVTMFSQCDEWGRCFAMDCPPGMYWDDVMKTCGMMSV